MALSNREYVGRALEQLNEGLRAFFERELRNNYGDQWEAIARSRLAEKQGSWTSTWDVTAMLGVMMNRSEPVFCHRFARTDQDVLRECRQIRNDWAHFDTFSLEYTCRALDSIRHLLRLVAASKGAASVARLKGQLEEQVNDERMEMGATPLTKGMGHLAGRSVGRFFQEYLGSPERPAPFGGRQQELAALDAWLADATLPFGLLVAPAGRGKSALVSQWVQRLTEQQRAQVVFVPISLRFNTTDRATILKLLGMRLAWLLQSEADHPSDSDGWAAEIELMLRRDRPEAAVPLLMVLDGLDEAAGWAVGRDFLFPMRVGQGVRLLVTARTLAGCDSEGWRQQLGLQAASTRTFDLPFLDLTGVVAVLRSLGEAPLTRADEPSFAQQLLRLSEGDPLLVRLYVEALREMKRRAGAVSIADLACLPPGLAGYMQRWWEEQRCAWGSQSPLREPAVRTILNLLACALGPLRTDDLLVLAQPEGLDSWLINDAIHSLARLIVGDGDGQGYAFSHARLGHYLAEQLRPVERTLWQQRFLDYGADTLAQLHAGALAPADTSAYVVRHYRAHLVQAGAELAQLSPLLSEPWVRAWEAHDRTYDGVRADVEVIWAHADAALSRATDDPLAPLRVQYRCGLTWAALNSIGSRIPPEMIVALIEHEIWSPVQALARITRIPDEQTQAAHLTALIPFLSGEVHTMALTHVREQMRHPRLRVQTLIALAAPLPPAEQAGVLDLAYASVAAIPHPIDRANQYLAIAHYRPDEIDVDEVLSDLLLAYADHQQNQPWAGDLYDLSLELELLIEELELGLSRQRPITLLKLLPESKLLDGLAVLEEWQQASWECLEATLQRLPPDEFVPVPLRDYFLRHLAPSVRLEPGQEDADDRILLPHGSLMQMLLPRFNPADRTVAIEALLDALGKELLSTQTGELRVVLWPWLTTAQQARLQRLMRQSNRLVKDLEAWSLLSDDTYTSGRVIHNRTLEQLLLQVRSLSDATISIVLPPGEIEETVNLLYAQAQDFTNPADRAQGLFALIPWLPEAEHEAVAFLIRDAILAIPPLTLEQLAYTQHMNQWLLPSGRDIRSISDAEITNHSATKDTAYQPRVFAAVARYLPPEERHQALRRAYDIVCTMGIARSWVWDEGGLTQQLVHNGCVDAALDLLRLVRVSPNQDEDDLSSAIYRLIQPLTEHDLLAYAWPQLLIQVQRIGNHPDRAWVLMELLAVTTGEARDHCLRLALQAITVIGNHHEAVSLLLDLAEALPPPQRTLIAQEVLVWMKTLPTKEEETDDDMRESILARLVPLLPDMTIAEACEFLLAYADETTSITVMQRLVLFLPLAELQGLVLRWHTLSLDADLRWMGVFIARMVAAHGEAHTRALLHTLRDTTAHTWVLGLFAAALTPPQDRSVALEFLQALDTCEHKRESESLLCEESDAKIMATIVCSYPTSLCAAIMPELVSRLTAMPLDTHTTALLEHIAPILAPTEIQQVLAWLQQQNCFPGNMSAFHTLSEQLPEPLKYEVFALRLAQLRPRAGEPVDVRQLQERITLAEYLSGDAREEMLLEVLQTLEAAEVQWTLDAFNAETYLRQPCSDIARLLVRLKQLLPPHKYALLHTLAEHIDDMSVRLNALICLQTEADPLQKMHALETVRSFGLLSDSRAVELTRILSEPDVSYEELREIIDDVEDSLFSIQAMAILGVLPTLSETRRHESVISALTKISALDTEKERVLGLRMLMPYAQNPTYRHALLDETQRIQSPQSRIPALIKIATYLPIEERAGCIHDAMHLIALETSDHWRTTWLQSLLPILQDLPRDMRISCWSRLLHTMHRYSRTELCATLRVVLPLLTTVGGEAALEVLAEEVIAHHRWLP